MVIFAFEKKHLTTSRHKPIKNQDIMVFSNKNILNTTDKLINQKTKKNIGGVTEWPGGRLQSKNFRVLTIVGVLISDALTPTYPGSKSLFLFEKNSREKEKSFGSPGPALSYSKGVFV